MIQACTFAGNSMAEDGPCECFFFFNQDMGQMYHHSLCSYVHFHAVIAAVALIWSVAACVIRYYKLLYFSVPVMVFGPAGVLVWLLIRNRSSSITQWRDSRVQYTQLEPEYRELNCNYVDEHRRFFNTVGCQA
jgi:hypothetical protein